jgi:hypothetical protein
METLTTDAPLVIDDLTAGGYVSVNHTHGIQIEERLNASPERWHLIYSSRTAGKIDIPVLATGVIRVTRTTTVDTDFLVTPAV